MNIKEVASIRGFKEFIDDYQFENEPIEVQMWNPLHFAVYHNHLEIVKFLVSELKVNFGLTQSKPQFEEENVDV